MQCDECSRLLAVLEQLIHASALATQRLGEVVEWRMPLLDYRRIAAQVTGARLDEEAARLELDKHRRDAHAAQLAGRGLGIVPNQRRARGAH